MLAAGTRIGPYEVVGSLGAGGMGEVYRATDTNLGRQVAIKVLPDAVAQDAERLARFDREARTLATLNHPGIAQIYGVEKQDGQTALVMELVEGPTLADRIGQGAISIDEALPIARQIAEALEAAHEQGIIHRDLKPANIKVRPDGTVKVLDFGLAKAMEPAGAAASSVSVSMSPTITTPAMTQMGMILGTAAYMSPEQAKGRTVDARADVWAFGAVLFEMLSGQHAFDGEDVADVLGAVTRLEPKWEALPASVPSRVTQVLRACLQKNVKARFAHIQDVRLALDGALDSPQSPSDGASVVTPGPGRYALPVAAAVAVTALLVSAAWWSLRPSPPVPRVTRLTMPYPLEQQPVDPGNSPSLAISADGGRVASWRSGSIVVRALDSFEGQVVASGRAFAPVFSPDGESIVFNDQNDATIKRVAVRGGPALTVTMIPAGSGLRGAVWQDDDTIVFGSTVSSGLWRVPASGGTAEPLTTLDTAQGEENHQWPDVLPGGRAVLFVVRHRSDEGPEGTSIVVRNLDTGEQRVVVPTGTAPKYVATGHLLFGFENTLWAVPFDIETLSPRGSPVPVVAGVTVGRSGKADFAVSRDGSLAYLRGADNSKELVWVDRDGRPVPLGTPAPPARYLYVRVSPDGTRVAVTMDGDRPGLWIYSVQRGTLELLDGGAVFNGSVAWTPDGAGIAYRLSGGIGWRRADGTGDVERLTTGFNYPGSWRPDGRALLITDRSTLDDIRMVSLDADRAVTTLVATPARDRNPVISPDGRWLAFESDVTGDDQVYVQPFPGGPRTPLSPMGGSDPRWAPGGRELFYRRTIDNATDAIMSVAVGSGDPSTWGAPRELFRRNAFTDYDVTPDGQQFVLSSLRASGESTLSQLVVVQNWFEELKRLVPTN